MSIIQNGSKFSVANINGSYEKLPVGVYMVNYDPQEGYFLSKKEEFTLPKKVYGDTSSINRWMKSFEVNSEKNLGILLMGLKGSGKTIMAQQFCIESKMPVLLINESYHGHEFVDFMTSKDLGSYICFLDEFEKIYPRDEEVNDFLSLMDGNYQTHNIFMLTSNSVITNSYLNNRLNRIKYKIEYSSMDIDVMNEVIDDMLDNKSHRDSIAEVFHLTKIKTFDILVALIKEMNLFKEDAIECAKHLNIREETVLYNVWELDGEKQHKCRSTYCNFISSTEIERIKIDHLPETERCIYTEILDYDSVKYLNIDRTEFLLTAEDKRRFRFVMSRSMY